MSPCFVCAVVNAVIKSWATLFFYFFDPVTNFAAGLEGMQIDAFIFQGKPQPLNHDVVPPAPFAVHGDAHVSLFQDIGERIAVELAAVVGIKDLWLTQAGQGFFELIHAEVGIHGVG